MKHSFSIVLLRPEIPHNTGAIGRLCVGLGVPLHLVRPLGFALDDRYIARAGLDLKNMKLRFAGANNPMYLVRDGELQEFRPVKNPIGNYSFVREFVTVETDVKAGDWVYMFSAPEHHRSAFHSAKLK